MMKLPDKILTLRKQNGMSQEELADKLDVSRQAVSRWENGSAQPDASNLLQISKLFRVSADYLLNDDYESDSDIPAVQNTARRADQQLKTMLALCVSGVGLLCNFVIYVLSRFIEVMVPYPVYQNGKKLYEWGSDRTGRSYKYFIQEYNLELLTFVFYGMFFAGLIYVLARNDRIRTFVQTKCTKWCGRLKR